MKLGLPTMKKGERLFHSNVEMCVCGMGEDKFFGSSLYACGTYNIRSCTVL